MEPNKLLRRVQGLERELASLRAELAPARSWKRSLGKMGMFLISYWALMSFFAAIGTATYVKFAFNIDYFESYRNAAAIKRLSEFHRQMGDEMLLRSNWKDALASYKAATAANPANTAAAVGEVKAAVLLPEEGHKLFDPSIVAAKLDKLRELYPDDPQIAYLDALQAFNANQTDKAIARCDAVLAKHRKFPGGYLLKSYLQQNNGDFKAAAATLEALLAFDPENGLAHSNLGYCYLLTGKRELALTHLETGMQTYPTMLNSISLAEAYRMAGNCERAQLFIDNAERVFAMPGMEDEYFVRGQWLWNHLPERSDDVESARFTITCNTPEQKRSVLRISQGMLKLTAGEYEAALTDFRDCLKLEPNYRAFLINKLRASVFSGIGLDGHKAAMTKIADALQAGQSP